MSKVRALATLALLISALLARAAPLAAQASLVTDLVTAVSSDGSSNPSGFATAGGKLFFFATEPSTGRELYRTDGTGAGTELMADLCPGPCGGGRLLPLADLDGTLLFGNFFGLARSDGTRAGTYSLNDATGVPLLLDPNRNPRVAVLGRFGYLEIFDSSGARTIWRTDGTQTGTRPLSALIAGLPDTLWNPVVAGGGLYFFAPGSLASPDGPGSLWRSDGTAAGTGKVADLAFLPRHPTAVAGRLLFASPAEQIWASDGTAAGTRQLSSFTSPHPLGGDPASRSAAPFRVRGGNAYFTADDGTHGTQVWASDGTPAGTRLFAPLTTATVYDNDLASRMELAGGRLVFEAFDTRVRPWASDGTPAGTALLADVPLNVSLGLLNVGGRVLFAEPPGATGEGRIWTTDGTPAGTAPLAGCGGPCTTSAQLTGLAGAGYFLSRGALWRTDGSPSGAGTRRLTDFDRLDSPFSILAPLSLGALPGRVFFPGRSPQYGTELWVTRGRPAASQLVANLEHVAPGSAPGSLTPLGNRLLFAACAGEDVEAWSTRGTPETTVQLTTGGGLCGSFLPLVTAGTTAFFLRTEGGGPAPRLWKSDGTPAGTVRVDTVPLGSDSRLAVFGGKALFTAPAAGGEAIWRTDGTSAGTTQAFVVPTTRITSLDVLGDEIYLVTFDQQQEVAWRSDGTQAGTRQLATASRLSGGTRSTFVRAGGTVFFVVEDEAGEQLWKTDGTAAGTVRVLDLLPAPAGVPAIGFPPPQLTELHGALFFFGFTPTGVGLWRSDGTPAGTAPVKDFVFSRFESNGLTAALGRLFFFASDGVHDYELWQSDGTPEGTVLVKDVFPGAILTNAPDSLPYGLAEAGGRVFWTADDGIHGFELWESDGNPANPDGTRLVQDLAPEGASSYPDQLTAMGDRLYFTADDGLHGRQLWTLPLSAPAGCQPGETRLCLNAGRFQVEIAWRDFQGNTGVGHAVPLTADTGYFWFFNPANVETVVKVLDGRALNQAFWIFYGALSSVEYTMTVTDTATGLTRRYFNPSGQLASVGDTAGFGPLGAFDSKMLETPASALPLVAARTDPRAATGSCAPSGQRLCLQGNRFAITAAWKDFSGHTGTGTAVPLTGDTGYFWFFSSTNVEVVAKVLDGRPVNDKFWLFYGALSNVEYTLTVTDTQTGAVKTYKNPLGQFGSVADTGAF